MQVNRKEDVLGLSPKAFSHQRLKRRGGTDKGNQETTSQLGSN